MKLDSFVGLVGGKPGYAYYFVGHIEAPAGSPTQIDPALSKQSSSGLRSETDRLIFLDPHYVNPQVDPEASYEK
jgi:hypothetical protein